MKKKLNAIGKMNKPPSKQKASVKNSYTSPSKIALQEKRNEALDYRRQGYDFRAIAALMKQPLSTVHGWVVQALNELPRENAEQVRLMMIEQLDQLQAAIYPNAAEGDLSAISQVQNLLREKARLFGLYPDQQTRGVRATVTNERGGPDENGQTKMVVEFIVPTGQEEGE